jgi:hypothetical protein
MIFNIIEDEEYKNLITEQIYEVISFLLSKGEEFNLTANIEAVEFEPKIPATIKKRFPPFTMFALVNYTYESIFIDNDMITFEASFGEENFISRVAIPFYSIFQIILDESILYINPTATVQKFVEQNKKIQYEQRSYEIFKNNAKNKRLL